MNENEILEKIVALSDGELSSQDASEVYQILATNPELQDELNYHLKMKNVYKKIETPPPSHLKSKILIGSGLAYVFWKTKGFLYSMVSGSLAVIAFLGYQFDVFSFKDDIIEKDFVKQRDQNEFILTNKIILPKLNEEYKNIEQFSTNSNSSISNSNQIKLNNSTQSIESGKDLSVNKFITDINLEESIRIPSEMSLVLSNSRNNEVLVLNTYSLTNQNVLSNSNELLEKFNFNFRKSFANSFENLDLDNSQRLDLNFSSISLMYEYSNSFEFGLEISGEEFAQRFQTNVNDSIANYQQFYNSYYLGIASKYYLPVRLFNNDLSFFSKGLVGATRLGPVFRLEIGGEYHLFDKISLIGSFELSSLIYNIDGKLNYSSRRGSNFGFKYDL